MPDITYKSSLILLLLFCCTACLEFEEEVSAIEYGLRDYELSSVLQEDWGHHSASHYNMDFSIIGEHSTFEYNEDALGGVYFTLSEAFDCYLFVEMFSPGKNSFQGGVFHHIGDRKINQIDDDEFVFRRLQFGRSESEGILVDEGTIHLRIDSKGIYRFEFDVIMENGKAIKGLFIGAPEYLNRQEQ